MTKRIPAERVVHVQQPALVAGGSQDGSESVTVIPIVEGQHIVGLEIRCRCGSHAVVDCIYDAKEQEQ